MAPEKKQAHIPRAVGEPQSGANLPRPSSMQTAVAEGSSSGSPRRIRRIPSLRSSLPRLTAAATRRNPAFTQQPFLNHAPATAKPTPTTTQPSFVSNPRTIPTQPSSIRDSPTPTASSTTTQRWLKFWYNISAFSEEDVGLKNRAGGPSEMMLI